MQTFTVDGSTYLGFSHYLDGDQMVEVPASGIAMLNGVRYRPYFAPGPGVSTMESAAPVPVQAGWYRAPP